jgi:aspartyl-tRNA(Asn)/glutamyl-tRNA(Gln) amidotransferase subunit B
MSWEAVIGLEVHVQLRTETKMFCRCPNQFGAPPNTLVCPICLGYPGALPVPNRQAVDLAVTLALALGSQVQASSVFARKNYFYPDLPKGYQISQFDRPLARGGEVPLSQSAKRVRLHRLHLEEDAGKLLHDAPGGAPLAGKSLADFNRCGVPLVEIVSEPEMTTPGEAQDYLQTLHQVLLYTAASDGNMEEGSLRCDANVSVRRPGQPLGTKSEVKNLNSFRFVGRALEYEIERQIEVLEAGGEVIQETRGYDADRGVTRPLRSKEEAHDYRYFPDPDLPPLWIAPERLAALAAQLPELPWQRRRRFVEAHGLAPEDAQSLTSSRELADYFEAAARALPANPRAVANWVRTAVLGALRERGAALEQAISPARLAALVSLVEAGRLSSSAGKEILAAIWASDETPEDATERLGLAQVSDERQLREWLAEVVADSPSQVAQYRAGKVQVASYFVGQVMKRSGGRAEPKRLQELVRSTLAHDPVAD